MNPASLDRARGVLTALVALVVTLGLAALSLQIGGYSPTEAFAALIRGSIGQSTTFVSITLVRTVPLLLTGLAVALAFRAGVWNIGAEGQFYAGAVAGVWTGLTFATLPALFLIPAVVLASAAAGLAWSAVPALMKMRLGVGEVITTILMNFVAIQLVGWLVQGPMMESRGVFNQSDRLPEAAQLPALIPGSRLHVGFALAIGLAVLLWVVFRYSRFGFSVRAVGASQGAAEAGGRLPVAQVTFVAFLASGAIAGIAGGVEVSGNTMALYEGLSPGYGYTAIAVALLAGLHPIGVIGTALLFGILEGGAAAMERSVGVPFYWVSAVEALVILSVLLADRALRRLGDD